jgi:hypothetical protein
MVKIAALAATLSLFALPTAVGGTRAGVSVPDTLEEAGKTLVLNGMGVREATVFNVDVYVAALYLEKKNRNANDIINSEQVKRLHLVFVRDVDVDDITDAWHDGFKKNASKSYAKLKPKIKELNGWMVGFKEKSTLTFTYVPGTGLAVHVNGKPRGTIADVFFARVMFAVFLGKPPNGGLKSGLLGG